MTRVTPAIRQRVEFKRRQILAIIDRALVPPMSRFWSKVDVRGPNDCWEWRGQLSKHAGYGMFTIGRAAPHLLAHRISWAVANGEEPGDSMVCHSCDNRSCVNPSHLWLGTHDDNMRDMREKGRSGKGNGLHGVLHPNAKLSAADLKLLRACVRRDPALEARLNISRSGAYKVRVGQSYRSDAGA